MKRSIQKVISLLIALIMLVGCESTADRREKLAKKFKSGNHYGRYGRQLSLANLSQEIGWFANKKMRNTEVIVFRENYGSGEGFYTGQKENNGSMYTWSAERIYCSDYSDFIRAGALFTEPVYITYDNQTIPLTAAEDDYGNIISDVGKNYDNPIYATVDILNKADIWYCTGMASDIRNQYSKVCAYSVLVGKCAEARANVNGYLLRDINRLRGSINNLKKEIENGGDGEISFSEEDLVGKREKLAKLEKYLADKYDTFDDLSNAIKEAIKYTRKQEGILAGYIARDVAYVTALSAQAGSATASLVAAAMNGKRDPDAQKRLAEATAKIAEYAIMQYGPTKEIQQLGKMSGEQAKINWAYGKVLMKSAEDRLDEQKNQIEMMQADPDFDLETQLVSEIKKSKKTQKK